METSALHVTVDHVVYHPMAETPPHRPYCFVYFITIHNDSDVAITLKGRKWVVTTDHGEVMAVEGAGVMGEFPTIQPGGRFSYNSYHLLSSRAAVAEGSYIGMDAKGRRVLLRIPRFRMVVPRRTVKRDA